MFAIAMCFVCIVMFFVLVPTWLRVIRRRRRLANRLEGNALERPGAGLDNQLMRDGAGEPINREQIEEILRLLTQELNQG